LLKLRRDSEPDETFDAFISLRVIPESIAQRLIQDLANYGDQKPEEYSDSEIIGILKSPEETRKKFRERLDGFLSQYGFNGNEFLASEGGNFLHKVYRGKGEQTIEVIYAGDGIEDGYCFNFISGYEFVYLDPKNLECFADASLVLNGVPEHVKSRIFSGLERKFDC